MALSPLGREPDCALGQLSPPWGLPSRTPWASVSAPTTLDSGEEGKAEDELTQMVTTRKSGDEGDGTRGRLVLPGKVGDQLR